MNSHIYKVNSSIISFMIVSIFYKDNKNIENMSEK